MLRATPVIMAIALGVISANRAKPPNPACPVKGSVDGKGDHVYLLPTDPRYPDQTIEKSRGERWFCTEAEATAAGWHARKK